MRKRIAWFSPHITHYNTYLYDRLSKCLGVELDLFFYEKQIPRYPWRSQLKPTSNVFFLRKILGIDWFLLVSFLMRRSKSYDVIVVAGWSEPTMVLLLTLFTLIRAKVVIWTDTPRVNRNRSLKQMLRSVWLRWILKKSTCLVTGKIGMDTIIAWGARDSYVFNFPFVTDLEYFSPCEDFSRPLARPLRICSSGRLDMQSKGNDIALKALRLLKNSRPEIGFKYTIAGSGPDEQRLRKLIVELGLEENVELLGWVEPDQLVSLYRSNEILLHTAIEDPFPNSVLEAMACGLIVIGSDTSGSVVERIVHGKNGFIHRTKDEYDVFKCLLYLIKCEHHEIVEIKKSSLAESHRWNDAYNISVFKQILEVC